MSESASVCTAGLVALMAAKAFGADCVAITDLKNDNLVLAEQLGADVCLNPKASATPAEVGEWLKASLPPYGPDVIIDCAGFESTLQVSLLSAVQGWVAGQGVCRAGHISQALETLLALCSQG